MGTLELLIFTEFVEDIINNNFCKSDWTVGFFSRSNIR